MISAEQNELMTRIGPGTPAGKLLRRYWQPVALVDEMQGERPVQGRFGCSAKTSFSSKTTKAVTA